MSWVSHFSRCWRKYTHFTAIILLNISCGFLFRTERVFIPSLYNYNAMNILKQFENRKLQYFRQKEKLLTYLKFMSNKWCSLLWLRNWLHMLASIENFSLLRVRLDFFYWMWNFQMKQKSFLFYIFCWWLYMFVYTDFCFAECQIWLSFTEYGIFKRKKKSFVYLFNEYSWHWYYNRK